MDNILINMSTQLKTSHVVIEADSYIPMKTGMVSPPTSKSARPKHFRRNEERFPRLSLRKIQMMRIFPVMVKVAKNPKHSLQNIFQALKSMAIGSCGESKRSKILAVLREFFFFFINIYHVKVCFAANLWLRSSVGSTAQQISGRKLFLLIPVEESISESIYLDFFLQFF